MESDFGVGSHPRKPKRIEPIVRPDRPTIHELAAREGHDLNSSEAVGPEAEAAKIFIGDHLRADNSEKPAISAHPSNPDESGALDESSNVASESAAADGNQASLDDAVEDAKPSAEESIWEQNARKHKKAGNTKSKRFNIELRKPQKIILLILALILIGASGALAYNLKYHSRANNLSFAKTSPVKPKPKVYYSPLSGLPVTQAESIEPVTGVMIENSLPARPQSGLSQAGVVFEAIAEAGITRFLALFQGADPTSVGPIRSARPYFVAWDLGYDAPYAHVGDSPDGLNDIQSWGVKDMDQFANANAYQRIDSRWAPHNVYTSMNALHQLENSKGWGGQSNFAGFVRKDASPAKTPTVTTINMNISSPDYAVKYVYNPAANDYERFEGAQSHIDANTNQQIAPVVVVALIIPYSEGALDSSGAYYSIYQNIGSGPAYVFQDGNVIQCTWSKASNSAPVKLTDSSGNNVKLDRGQTWLTALGDSSLLNYD